MLKRALRRASYVCKRTRCSLEYQRDLAAFAAFAAFAACRQQLAGLHQAEAGRLLRR